MEDIGMARKRAKAEEIVAKLRQVDMLTSQGRPVAEAVRSIGVTEVTYYRWRSEYGGLRSDQVKPLKELESQNARLRRAVSDLTLEKLILKEAASGNWQARPVAAPAWTILSSNTVCPEHLACRVLGQHRSTQLKVPTTPDDEAALTADIVALATQYDRYGCRRIRALLARPIGC
jgi:putative transposase